MNFLSTYSIVLFAHVLAGAALLGGSILAPVTRAALRRAPDAGSLRAWHAFALASMRLDPVFGLVALGTGMYLGSGGVWRSGWYPIAMAAFIVNTVLAIGVVGGALRRIARALQHVPAAAPVPLEASRTLWSRALDHGPNAILASDVSILFLMLARPSFGVSVAVVVTAHVLSFAIHALLRARRESRAPAESALASR